MSIIKMAFVKLGKVFLAIAAVIRRMFCCIRRRRRNSDVPLPITVDVKQTLVPAPHFSSNNESGRLHNWSSWEEDEPPSSIKVVDNVIHETQDRRVYSRQSSNEPEPEIDYFQDMVPEIRKSKTLLIKNIEEPLTSLGNESLSKRLTVEPQITPLITTELQHWVDNEESWEDSLGNDIMSNANAALRESKILERERRAAENQRKKQEKEAIRTVKKDHLFTKIS